MSKKLSKLLDQPERAIVKAVDKLELLNGYPSEDARLLAENSQAVRAKIIDLGLDPDDTTGEELYHALLAKFEKDNALIDQAVGLHQRSTADQRAAKAIQLVEHMAQTNQALFLKHPAAKDLLRQSPPRKLMKQLGYRSIESLLKREDINTIYLLLPIVESASWQKNFAKKVSKLRGTDYELRAPELTNINPEHLADLAPGTQTLSNSLVGAVGFNSSPKIQDAGVLTLALLLMDGLEELAHSESGASLAHLNPAIVWWEQAKSLMALCGEDAVSLNLKDVADNHLSQHDYQERSAENGRKSLWSELVRRYKNQVAQAEESVANLENEASEEITKLTTKQPSKNLALEYAEAIANEF